MEEGTQYVFIATLYMLYINHYTGVPQSVVVAASNGQLAARLHFEAEHTNVLVVTVELLNGCLASTEIENMTAKIINPVIPEFPVR